ncbi:hypothetical protein DFJ74DRAFT_655939 [Hyaloraphidium curvatum]|nr:hypothetical protein DFJ74DRAFT_655939 [Hyaloraphidium curvatum]
MSVIKSDLTENTYGSEGNGCVFVGNAARLNCRAVDDLIIGFAVEPIDGKFGILGSAGPSFIRPAGSTHEYLPVTGSMRFDSADLDSMATDGILEAVILHEMGHVLGIGTLWELKGYLDPPNCRNIVDGGADPTGARFTGPAANASLAVVDPSDSLRLGYVPVEDQFRRPGTTCGHWREATFKQELMTGFVSSNGNPLSYITAYSLVDLGYEIDPASEIINKTWNAATAQPDGGEGEKLIPLVGCFEGVPPPTIPEKTQRSKNPGRELRSSNGR